MTKIVDFNEWDIYEGASEGSGRSEKIWLKSKETNQVGLFKFPKSPDTTEHISEHLASKIANSIGLSSAHVEIGQRNSRLGCMSYLINEEHSVLVEGVNFINFVRPEYDPERLYDSEKKEYYSMDMVFKILSIFDTSPTKRLEVDFIKMMIFDALIGNSDRHHSNWAILINDKKKKLRFCPIYDNGSSLCCYVEDVQADEFFRDEMRFSSLVDSKSKSRIRIDSRIKKEPSHKEVLLYIEENYNKTIKVFVNRLIQNLSTERIAELIDEYDEVLLSERKKKLIYRFLIEKTKIIGDIFS